MDPNSAKKLAALESKWEARFVPLSFWGDGVPVSWNRDESVQCYSWALPGLPTKLQRAVRIPFTVIPKAGCEQTTHNRILEYFGWSLSVLMLGRLPPKGPGGEAATPEALEVEYHMRGALVALKGDWEFFSYIVGLPHWRSSSGICFRCNATRQALCDLSGDKAAWRQPENRLTTASLLATLATKKDLSPIWGWPEMDADTLKMDWLHVSRLVCDLAVL